MEVGGEREKREERGERNEERGERRDKRGEGSVEGGEGSLFLHRRDLPPIYEEIYDYCVLE